MRWARQSRSAGAEDNVVELLRPLGLVLNEDKRTGNVYVETVAPGGNAARTGKVRERRGTLQNRDASSTPNLALSAVHLAIDPSAV
jgi:hypothetical protein